MLLNRALAAILTILVLACPACTPEGYNLRGPRQKVGETIRIDTTTTMTDGTMEVTASTFAFNGKADSTTRRVMDLTILEMQRDQVTALRVHFIADTQSQTVEMMGQTSQSTTDGPLHGKTVVGTLSDGQWSFQLEGSQPTAEQSQYLQDLAKNFQFHDRAALAYPDHPVKIGQSWEVDAAELHTGFDRLQRPRGKLIYTLEKIEEVDGEQLAHISVEMDFSADLPGEDGASIRMIGTGPLVRSLKTYVDKSATLTGTMELNLTQSAETSVRMVGPMTMTSSESRTTQ